MERRIVGKRKALLNGRGRAFDSEAPKQLSQLFYFACSLDFGGARWDEQIQRVSGRECDCAAHALFALCAAGGIPIPRFCQIRCILLTCQLPLQYALSPAICDFCPFDGSMPQ